MNLLRGVLAWFLNTAAGSTAGKNTRQNGFHFVILEYAYLMPKGI